MIITIWELPQTILALFVFLLYGTNEKKKYKNCYVIKCKKIAGVSLGRYIFLNDYYYDNEDIIKHEYGHSIQSLIFGWLYLIVIGFFSFGHTHIWKELVKNKDYYTLYPERWADILGKTDNRKRIK